MSSDRHRDGASAGQEPCLSLAFDYAEHDLYEMIRFHRERGAAGPPLDTYTLKSLVWQMLQVHEVSSSLCGPMPGGVRTLMRPSGVLAGCPLGWMQLEWLHAGMQGLHDLHSKWIMHRSALVHPVAQPAGLSCLDTAVMWAHC